jgi:hypothetical protein
MCVIFYNYIYDVYPLCCNDLDPTVGQCRSKICLSNILYLTFKSFTRTVFV